jgi:Xaa-Pro aminopeptidase
MTFHPFLARREHLLKIIGNGVAIIPTAPEVIRNRDAHYPFRPDSYFWYLTGFAEPESVLVLLGGAHPRSILFCRPKDVEREIWDGFRYGPEGAQEVFGFDACFLITELDTQLPQILSDREGLWHTVGCQPAWDQRIGTALEKIREQARSGKRPPAIIHDLRTVLDRMRLVKDAAEIQLMKHAASITSEAHRRAMQQCRPGMMEFALEAEVSHEFRRCGSEAHAYTPIVAGGKNACTLHYVDNCQPLHAGDLVLIDAGCEWQNYAADITRTFPVNGRFSPAQRDCYEIVLASQSAAIEAIKPGNHFMRPHETALRVLTQGMVDLGLLEGSVDGLIESGAYKSFYMHRTSHWLGLDVHDAGDYKTGSGAGDWTELQAGMVLTVEPGLYIRAGENVPKHLANIGVRIEDDALVTECGAEIYTSAPKSIAEIEACMRQ